MRHPMTRPLHIKEEHARAIHEILARHVPTGCHVYAYGSRAKRAPVKPPINAYADLDLCLRSKDMVAQATIRALKQDFVESMLPYHVDVVDWHKLTPDFRQHIEKDFVELMGVSP